MNSAALPPRIVELMGREIARGALGRPAFTPKVERLFRRAIEPHTEDLAKHLASCERRPDGTMRFYIPRGRDFKDAHLADDQRTITATFDPITGGWTSDVATGQPGLARFAGHVWRVGGGDGRMPEYALLSFLGLAYLFALAETPRDPR